MTETSASGSHPADRRVSVLVLSIDRDDDFGRKASVKAPIVGRDANVKAATALALADPEDSDSNSVFAAVQTYDQLVKDGVEAEVVTLCGDVRVGSVSDRKLSEQFERVLADIRPERCVFVTDGAEDEFILPLVTSRLRVDAVRRVIVKQNADIEGTYYIIKKALEDDKFQRTFFIPLALGLLVYGAFVIAFPPEVGSRYAVAAITLTLGLYFLGKALHVGAAAGRILADFYSGLTSGRVSLFTSMLALFILGAGIYLSAATIYRTLPGQRWEVAILEGLLTQYLVWWVVGAAVLSVGGKVVDAYVREGEILWSYWILPFSLVAAGLILTAALDMALALLQEEPFFTFQNFIRLVLGFGVAFLGSISNAYIRETRGAPPPRKPRKAAAGR